VLLKRFYDDGLAQASYLLASERSDAALVVDPNRDVEQYIAAAEAEGLRIAHVTETHIHADFVSGSRELAQRTGATLYLSDEGGADWHYGYAAESGAVLLQHESRIDVGDISITALHTPGHTPEHLAFLVVDRSVAPAPLGLLSGDFVFVGDVGRPDLLEKAANVQGTMAASARQLFHSLERLRDLPDHLQIWPGHGAGSACGKSLGAMPQSTLGYERIANWAFHITDEAKFVGAVLEGQPEPPSYFGEMKRINRDGPRILGGSRRPQRIAAARVGELLAQGTLLVDTRPAADYATAHILGTINIPLNRSFTTWAGWLVPYTRDFYLLIDHARVDALDQAVRDLAMIGLDRIGGYIDCDEETLAAWRSAGGALGSIRTMTAQRLAERLAKGDVSLVDVRAGYEWADGHVPGARHIPLGQLPARFDELPSGPVVMHCLTGSRSAIAASLVAARGREVWNLEGGFAVWKQAGYPVETTVPAP
jgi:hydroxyacylglutathione hydrolase